MGRTRALAVASVMALLPPALARANGRFPTANHLVVAPTQPSRMMLRTTFGLLLSSDGGGSWDWVCEKAVGYAGVQDPSVAFFASGALLAGVFEGLAQSADGCGWSFAGGALAKQSIVDVAVRRAEPDVGVVLSSTFRAQGDGGLALYDSFVFVTRDGGRSFSQLGAPLDPVLVLQTIDVTESDPARLYVSGVRAMGGAPTGVLLVSSDGGASWVERQVPLQVPGESAPYIAAVDPTRADRVYVRNAGAAANRLLVTADAGSSFQVVYTSQGSLLGFALSPDGAKFYFGGPKDGLSVGARDTLAYAKKSDLPLQCLATSGPAVWACSVMTQGFILGSSNDDGATFAPKLRLDGVRGPLACGAGTSAAACAPDWPQLRDLLASGSSEPSGPPPPPQVDAGTGSAALRAGGCSAAPLSPGPTLALLALALGLPWVALRRARTVKPRRSRGG